MTPEQALELVGGGETNLHYHHIVQTADDLHRSHQLERVVFTDVDYDMLYGDDIVFVTANAPVSITLPLARGGIRVTISRIAGASDVTVLPSGTDLVDTGASKTITSTADPVNLKAVSGVGYYSV